MHLSVPKVSEQLLHLAGFSTNNANVGEGALVRSRIINTSDEVAFQHYINRTCDILFPGFKEYIPIDSLSHFIVTIHSDGTADLYTNDDILILIEAQTKRTVQAGELLFKSDIANIRRVRITNIDFQGTDKVLLCFKIGWKFLYFYDLNRPLELLKSENKLAEAYIIEGTDHVFAGKEDKLIETTIDFVKRRILQG